ncbi:Protein of unknown function [Pyronema omphalodes CBS 100304]|uniref:Uncharacterized protein n=1 Tax=Pyronema omphalodes (strain CBS 100304) TaxID=1076935 RepID=U4L4R6_PYROM|nr:Protein of unknown function [Pyronema omphalodes CBS 100304]
MAESSSSSSSSSSESENAVVAPAQPAQPANNPPLLNDIIGLYKANLSWDKPWRQRCRRALGLSKRDKSRRFWAVINIFRLICCDLEHP